MTCELIPPETVAGAFVLELSDDDQKLLLADAVRAYPHEGCGLLLGHWVEQGEQRVKVLQEVCLTQNDWEGQKQEFAPTETQLSATRRYMIAPQMLLATQKYAREVGLEVIGIYHSHPDAPAIPSECDRAWAWPIYSYLIISVCRGAVEELRSWELNEQHQFQAEPLVIKSIR